ncbi:MAG: hypothetical protein HPY45_12875 [Anaerolineae bacterium]|nr:hypothetical protein [Anaerolineae bacterium]
MRFNLCLRILLTIAVALGMFFSLYPPSPQQAIAQFPTVPFPTLPATTPLPTIQITPIPTLLPSCDHWKVEIDLPYTPAELQQLGGIQKGLANLQNQINPGLTGLPIQSDIKTTSTSDGGAVYTLTVEGYGVELLRQVLFEKLHDTINIFNVPISMALSGNVKAGQTLKLLASVIPSLGQKWSLDNLEDIAKLISSQIECSTHVAPGSPLTQELLLEFLKDGFVTLDLLYGRAWEKLQKAPVRITLELCSFPALFNLVNDALKKLLADPPPAPQAELGAGEQPSSYDWSSGNNRLGSNVMTSVKDQRSCGSCWAFGSVGVLEAAIKMQGGGEQDLSEQYLVSCNTDGWSCNGGWWAHDYHKDKPGKLSNPPGAVYESNMPYTASNGTCSYVSNHPYTLQSWQYVGDETLASVPSIKAAIQQYGPVAAAVCASDSFMSYSGGVYDKNECGNVNHAIIIVGWDDATQSWKIKNSWGTGWGEGGYMRIKWGVNGVGKSASAIVFGGGGGVPSATPVATATRTPTASLTSTLTATPRVTVTPQNTLTPPSALPPGTYDDTHTALNYNGQWYLHTGEGPANGTVHFSNNMGNSVSFIFQGSQFSVGFTGHPTRGVMIANIDGSYFTLFNQFSWTLKYQREWISPALSPGVHTVTIQHGLGLQADIDFIRVFP